ncbi:MAG TPA: hypothetical protein PKX56_00230 [Marmoricola sp.]|nr:hypothetical protein [Marmoricola sp.]HNN48423.1 hypothetical protein [Marmoricola sp.]
MRNGQNQIMFLRVFLTALAATLLLVTTGCSTSSPDASSKKEATDSSSPTAVQSDQASVAPESSAPTNALNLPECDSVWVTGQVLPEDFQGCAVAGVFVEPEIMYCESGQSLATYQNRYYAALGQVINEVPNVRKSPVWRKMLRTCTG